MAQSPDERAENFQHDVLRRVRKLDADFPGSTFEWTLQSYGKNGRYLVLVDGPISNLSKYVGVLTDFIARLRALRLLNQWDVFAKQALALNRHFLVQKFGHLSFLLWARPILKAASVTRFRVPPFHRLQIPAKILISMIYRHTLTPIVVNSVAEMSRVPNTHAFFALRLWPRYLCISLPCGVLKKMN